MTKELTELGNWKLGQKVLVSNNYGDSIIAIDRITNGRNGTIYIKDLSFDISGHQRGGGTWNSYIIKPATEEDIIRIKGRNSISRLSKINWSKLSPAKAIEIEDLLNKNGIITKIV